MDAEPTYNPDKNLALEQPKDSLFLRHFGYSEAEIAQWPPDYGVVRHCSISIQY